MTGLEARDAAAGAVAKAPRVTLDQIKLLIDREEFHVFDDQLTICVLTLKNGYKVVGQSAAADPRNFNEELGAKIAREKAVAEIWPLAGFLLRDTLHKGDHPAVMRCKVILHDRSQAYGEAPRTADGKPPGRWTEKPWSYKDAHGNDVSGVSHIADPSDPVNIVLDGERLRFGAVCPPPCDPNGAEENLIFGQYTPSFNLEAHVRNHAVLAKLERGRAYYVDFIPAD